MYQYRVDTGNFQVSAVHASSLLLLLVMTLWSVITLLVQASSGCLKASIGSSEVEDLGKVAESCEK